MAILNVVEAADFLKMSRRSLETLVRLGKVPGAQLVNKWVFSEQQLIDFVEAQATEQANANATTNLHDMLPIGPTRKRNPSGPF